MQKFKMVVTLSVTELVEVEAENEEQAFDVADEAFRNKYERVYDAVEDAGGLISTTTGVDDGDTVTHICDLIDRRIEKR